MQSTASVLLKKSILKPSGEISKDKINLVAGAITQPFAEMVWVTTGGDTSGLDGRNMRSVSKQLHTLAQKGHIILMITHDLECALATCSRALVIRDGTLADDFQIDDASRWARLCTPSESTTSTSAPPSPRGASSG